MFLQGTRQKVALGDTNTPACRVRSRRLDTHSSAEPLTQHPATGNTLNPSTPEGTDIAYTAFKKFPLFSRGFMK